MPKIHSDRKLRQLEPSRGITEFILLRKEHTKRNTIAGNNPLVPKSLFADPRYTACWPCESPSPEFPVKTTRCSQISARPITPSLISKSERKEYTNSKLHRTYVFVDAASWNLPKHWLFLSLKQSRVLVFYHSKDAVSRILPKYLLLLSLKARSVLIPSKVLQAAFCIPERTPCPRIFRGTSFFITQRIRQQIYTTIANIHTCLYFNSEDA